MARSPKRTLSERCVSSCLDHQWVTVYVLCVIEHAVHVMATQKHIICHLSQVIDRPGSQDCGLKRTDTWPCFIHSTVTTHTVNTICLPLPVNCILNYPLFSAAPHIFMHITFLQAVVQIYKLTFIYIFPDTTWNECLLDFYENGLS